jgi:carbonic anhydrase
MDIDTLMKHEAFAVNHWNNTVVRRSSLLPELLLAAIALSPAPAAAQWKTPWSYAGPDGPEHWGDLDPAYAACKNGRQQSPIDIRTAQKAQLPTLRFEYLTAPLKYLINNGYTIRVNYHAPISGGFLIVGDKRYQLTQFHFHRPSEEMIHGKPYEMVIHLMHESSGGQTAGVAVLLKAGRANATIEQLWNHMPMTKGDEHEIPGVQLDPAALLPGDLSYYTYTGSLTAPPCDESVTWFILKTPVEISQEQINAFAKLYPHDVRPIQPLHGRIVKESQ